MELEVEIPVSILNGVKCRPAKAKTTTNLAEAIGLTFQQVQKYEKGANRVSSSRLVDLARILDVNIPYFFAEMSAAVAGQTPSQLIHSKQLPHLPSRTGQYR